MRFAAVLLACACLLPAAARATVLCQVPDTDGALGALVDKDPRAAIRTLRSMLEAHRPAADGQPGIAHLYAMLADAYWIVGDLTEGRRAIAAGQAALAATDNGQLRRRLQLNGYLLQANQGEVSQAAAAYETASAPLPGDAPDIACVLINRGYLRQLTGRSREAFSDLTRAYRIAQQRGAEGNRMLAGTLLAYVYTATGFPEEARQYADEVIAYAGRSGDRRWLAEGYFRLGDVALLVQDYSAAESQFARALALWNDVGFPIDVQAAQQRLCATQAKLPQRDRARSTCREAYRLALAIEAPQMAKAVLGSLGEVELRDGHAREALGLLDRALAMNGVDLNRGREAEFYGLRGEARQHLGDYAGAYRDATAYLAWLVQSNLLARDLGQIAVTRVRFEAAIQEQQALRARDAAQSDAQRASRQLLERSILMACVIVVLAMAVAIMWARRRRQDTERAARAAEERIGTMSRVTGGIAHDFNNQLTVMMQATGLLAGHPAIALDGSAQKLVQAIRHAGAACADVTAQMLSFSRQQNLHPEPIRMCGLLAELRPTLEHLAGARIEILFEVDEPSPVVYADHRQLEAALLNVVGNARDALPQGGIVRIRVSRRGDDRVLIEVVDNGCGMSPDVLARATEPFYSTKPVGGGSGLGLSMVQGFATQSGGSLELHSEPNRGTTVQLELPAARA